MYREKLIVPLTLKDAHVLGPVQIQGLMSSRRACLGTLGCVFQSTQSHTATTHKRTLDAVYGTTF